MQAMKLNGVCTSLTHLLHFDIHARIQLLENNMLMFFVVQCRHLPRKTLFSCAASSAAVSRNCPDKV